MKMFSKKLKLPHQPLADSLPNLGLDNQPVKPWLRQTLEQRLLARELQQINQKIIALRQQHYELRRNLKHSIRLSTWSKKLSPELSLKQPSKQQLFFSTSSKRFKNLSQLLQRTTSERKTGLTESSLPLLDRLRQGVIELQQKWAEVYQKLQTVESLSPEVNRQLETLDQQLSQLEKISLEKPLVISVIKKPFGSVKGLNYSDQRRVRREVKEMLSHLPEGSRDSLTELLQINKELRQLKTIKPPTELAISEVKNYLGKSNPLSPKDHQRIVSELHQRLARILVDSPVINLRSKEISQIERQLKQEYLPKSVKYRGVVPVLPKYIIPPSKTARKRAKEDVGRFLMQINRSVSKNKFVLDQLLSIDQKIRQTEKLVPTTAKIIQELHYHPQSYQNYQPRYYQKQKLELAKKLLQLTKNTLSPIVKNPVKLTPELAAIKEQIASLNKLKLSKVKIASKIRLKSDYSAGELAQERQDTESLLVRIIKDPFVLLQKIKIRTGNELTNSLESKAKKEVQKMLRKIDFASTKANSELLQIEQSLDNLEKIEIQQGKKLTKFIELSFVNPAEQYFLKYEQANLGRKLVWREAKPVIESEELREIERKLAEL